MLFLLFGGCSFLEIKNGKTTYNVGGVKMVGSGSTYEEKDVFGKVVKTENFSQIGVEF